MALIVNADNLEELLEQACVSGSSGRGGSFWSVSARCGMRALLNEEQDKLVALNGTNLAFSSDKPVGKRVGSAYHKLHEWRHEGLIYDGIFATELTDPSFQLAMSCFEAYVGAWAPSVWGRVLHTEYPLPRDKSHALFDGRMTARLDCVTHMSEQECLRASQERDVPLPGPGTYIIDYKTEGMPHDPRYYTDSVQALWYPYAATMEWSDVRGIIFDVIRKPRRKGEGYEFHALFAPLKSDVSKRRIGALLDQGESNNVMASFNGLGNPAECVKFGIPKDDICPYYQKECTFTRGET